MKPLKLTLEAFGTFPKKTIIDFQKLSKDGVFLISGETGSGKTTIFDAICYALYGEANSKNREPKYFRSQFAEPSQDTYVELIFECFNQQYTIKRCPEYTKVKTLKNGTTKTTNKSSEVSLILPNNMQPLTKEKDVKAKIQEILGLNCEQFRKIVMIAQGEFDKFLNSTSKDKGEILNTVFGTQKYVKFIDILKDKTNEYKIKYSNNLNSVVNMLLSISYGNDWEYFQDFEYWKSLKLEDKDIEIVLPHLKNYIDILSKEKSTLKNSLETSKNSIDILSKEINNYEVINNNIKIRDTLMEKLSTLKNEQNEIDSIKSTLKRLDVAKSIEINYINYKKSLKEIDTLKSNLNSLELNIDSCTKDIESLKDNQMAIARKLPKTINNLDDISIELNTILNDLRSTKNDIQNNGTKVRNIIDKITTYNLDKSKIEEKRQKLATMTNIKTEKEHYYSNSENLYNLNIAGVLAEQLQEGKPCLVCGSTHHPNVAVKCNNALSKGQLEALKQELEDYQNKYRKFQTDFLLEEERCNHKKMDIIDNATELKISSNDINEINVQLNDLRNSLATDYKQIDNKIKSVELDIKNLKSINDNLNKLINYSNSLNGSKKSILESLNNTILESNSLKDIYLKALKDNSIEDEKSHLELLQLYTNYNYLKDKVSTFENSILDYSSRINEYNKSIGNNTFTDVSNLKNDLNIKQNEYKNIVSRNSIINSMLENNSNIYDVVSKKVKSISDSFKKYKDVEYLYKIASGNISGEAQKIAFDNYVQAYYFEKVLISANKKINIMSSGRYSLIRSDSGKTKAIKSGLDINIFDAYTGMTRTASTLSGGERFMASLSLALGLSEVVQQQSGGIKIDAMFIDEGFGTLDNNQSLQQAIKVIDGLAVNNRIVGIISHVTELQEHIPNQLKIVKSKSGSTIN